MASAKELMMLKHYLDPKVKGDMYDQLVKKGVFDRRNPELEKKHFEQNMKPIYDRKLSSYKPGKFVERNRRYAQEMREDAFGPWYEDDDRRREVASYRDEYKEKRDREAKKMSGSIKERQKKVRKQNELARQQDKIHPFETYQSNEMGNFPFGGYSEDAQLRSNGTRQGRMYNLQNRLPARESVSEYRKRTENKKKNTKTRKVLENAFNRKK